MNDDEPTASVVDLAKKRFELAQTAYSQTRPQAIEDTKFALGDSDNGWQWPDGIREQIIAAKRACLTVNLTAQHCNQIINQIRQNRPSIRVLPVDNFADKKTAEILGGLVRNIQTASCSDDAHDTAAEHAIYGGEGYWRIVTEYESEKSFNQKIVIKIIPNPNLVYIDPFCIELDKSDAEWGFVFEDISREECKRDHPDVDPASWVMDGPTGNGWVQQDTVRRAEYFYCEYTPDEALQLSDGSFALKSEVEQFAGWEEAVVNRRPTQRKSWKWCKLLGGEDKPLDEKDWPGNWLPIVSIVGKEMNVNGQIIRKGIVRDLKDPARMVNYSYSAAVQSIALQNKIPYTGPAAAFEGHEDQWAAANVTDYGYLPWNHVDDAGNPVPEPKRQAAAIMPEAQVRMLELSTEQMRAASGQQNANFGIRSDAQSGIGIQRLKQQGEVATFHFPDNLARGLRYEGKILIDLIPKVLDTKRIIRILGLDGKQESATLDPNAEQAYAEEMNQVAQEVSKIFNPTLGNYDVVIDTGPSYQTQRQEAFQNLSDLAGRNPQLMQVAGDLIMRAADFPMAEQLADRLEKTLPPGLADDKMASPEKLQAQLAQQTQQMQQMGQMLDAAEEELKKLQNSETNSQTAARKVELDNQIKQHELALKDRELALKETQIQIDQYNAETNRMKVAADVEPDEEKDESAKLALDWDKAVLASETTLAVAKMSQATSMATAATAADGSEEAGEPAEPKGNDALAEALKGLVEAFKQPKTIIRGPDGRATGIQ